jgi:hypothetical protein
MEGFAEDSGTAAACAPVGIDAHPVEERGRDCGAGARGKRRRASKVAATGREFRGFVAVSEEPVVTDALEATRQDVEEESAEEIDGVEVEDFSFAAVRGIAPSQPGNAVVHAEEAIVGEGNAVGVAGEVVEDLPGPPKGFLA